MQKSKIENQKSQGVTLIELIVVLAIFMIMISVAFSIFISTVKRQKSILTEQELLNQTSYVIEYMSRTIRTAVKDNMGTCVGAAPPLNGLYMLTRLDTTVNAYGGIKFLTDHNVCQEFFRDTDGVIKEIKNGQSPQNMLSSKFKVKYLRFILNGSKFLIGTGSSQPRITIALDITTQASLVPGGLCAGVGTCMALCPQGGAPTTDCNGGTVCCPNPTDQYEKIIQTTVSQINLNAP